MYAKKKYTGQASSVESITLAFWDLIWKSKFYVNLGDIGQMIKTISWYAFFSNMVKNGPKWPSSSKEETKIQ